MEETNLVVDRTLATAHTRMSSFLKDLTAYEDSLSNELCQIQNQSKTDAKQSVEAWSSVSEFANKLTSESSKVVYYLRLDVFKLAFRSMSIQE